MKVDEKNGSYGPNTVNNGRSDDSCTMLSLPWFPTQTRRKSRLGTHRKKQNSILQDITPGVLNCQSSHNDNISLRHTFDSVHPTEATKSSSVINPAPLFKSKASTTNSIVSPNGSPVLLINSFKSTNNIKEVPDHHINISADRKPNEIFSVKSPQKSGIPEDNKLTRSSDLEFATPSKSCLKKPRTLSEEATPIEGIISERLVPTPKKEVRFVEPVAPLSEPIPQPFTKISRLRSLPSQISVKGTLYNIDCILGEGGSSVIYQVTDIETSEIRALKRVVLVQDESIAMGFLEEVETLRKLQSCLGIIKMFDHDVVSENGKKVLYVIMEKAECDLKQIMQSIEGPEKLNAIIFYWSQMLLIVNEIHKHDIVHSDLKPANFVAVKSRLKLIDFGIASSMPEDKTSIYKDVFSGTLSYMSPEAMSLSPSGFRVSRKSDVWSLGCILYSWVYGHLPFHNSKKRWKDKYYDIVALDKQVEFPEKEGIPTGLMNAMKSCLQKDPNLRPTVTDLLKNGRTDYIYPVNDS